MKGLIHPQERAGNKHLYVCGVSECDVNACGPLLKEDIGANPVCFCLP